MLALTDEMLLALALYISWKRIGSWAIFGKLMKCSLWILPNMEWHFCVDIGCGNLHLNTLLHTSFRHGGSDQLCYSSIHDWATTFICLSLLIGSSCFSEKNWFSSGEELTTVLEPAVWRSVTLMAIVYPVTRTYFISLKPQVNPWTGCYCLLWYQLMDEQTRLLCL